jgi:FkbM family methyltransferase
MLKKIIKNLIPKSTKYELKALFGKYFFLNLSYSQCGEDIVIESIFNKNGVNKIFYVDIGANHPYYLSNTAKFYRNSTAEGGLLIEPNPRLAKILKKSRPKDIVLNVGVNICNEGLVLPFYVMEDDVLSTFSKPEVDVYVEMGHKLHEVINVKCHTINTIFEQYCQHKKIDLLSLDVEGMDYDVIRSVDFTKFKPTVICVETVQHRNFKDLRRDDRITSFLVQSGYSVYAQNFVNTIFVESNYLNKVV